MRLIGPRSTFLAFTSTLALLAGCGGDELLGPPDGAGCTRGTVAAGDSVLGVVDASSCQAYSTEFYTTTYRDSWTLHMAANSAYAVRLLHRTDPATGLDQLKGHLYAFERLPGGDAGFATGSFGSFGSANAGQGLNEEMYLTTTTPRVVSLRVESESPADTGAYALIVEKCPLTPALVDVNIDSLGLSSGCRSYSEVVGDTQLVSFITLPVDTGLTYSFGVIRTSGNASLRGFLAGPDLDYGCWTDFCFWDIKGPGTVMTLSATPTRPSTVTLGLFINADSSAAVDVLLGSGPSPTPSRPVLTTPYLRRRDH